MFGKPRRSREQEQAQNGCPIVCPCVSGKSRVLVNQLMKPKCTMRAVAAPWRDTGSGQVTVSQGAGDGSKAAALLESLGQQREDQEGVFWGLFISSEPFCFAVSWRKREASESQCKTGALFTDCMSKEGQ